MAATMPDSPSPPHVWFVTGASSGFGRALSREILQRGDRVIATARSVDHLRELAAEFPATCEPMALDVTDAAQVNDVVPAAAKVWGRLDVVVNNAGYGLIGALEECSDAQIERNIATNLLGPIHVMRAALPIFREQGSGHFVTMSAAAVISNYAGFSVYGGAKAGLEAVCEAVRAEAAPFGVKMTLVQPGPFRTEFISRSLDRAEHPIAGYEASSGKFAAFLAGVDGKQPGDPERAASIIVDAVKSGRAPLRLPLGAYVVEKIKRQAVALGRTVTDWEAVAKSADFPAA